MPPFVLYIAIASLIFLAIFLALKVRSQHDTEQRWEAELRALREEFRSSAGAMLSSSTDRLNACNEARTAELLAPFRERLAELQESLAVARKERSALGTALSEQLRQVQASAGRMVSEGDKLTSALRGGNKLQGTWGELQLEQALADCGLVKGENFLLQNAIEDTAGSQRMIPDATLLFPDGRRVFIDSKMSLTAYLRYTEATTDDERKAALADHLASIRSHVRNLSEKDYPAHGNRSGTGNSFDYTLMFLGNEGALALALSSDDTLWEWAFRRMKVVIVSRMALFPLLWLIRMSWQNERQSASQQKLLADTGRLIERIERYLATFDALGQRLKQAQGSYDDARKALCDGPQSIVSTGNRIAAILGKEARRLSELSAEND